MNDIFDVKIALEQAEFKLQTIAQLQKDLDRAQCNCTVSTSGFYKELAAHLQTLTSEKLKRLLYLIDLPENCGNLPTTNVDFEQLSEQIIKREAFKVYLRKRFSD